MSLPKVVLGGGLVMGLLAAPPAEARFGKHSDSHESSKPVHEATAIGSDRDTSKKDDENKNRSSKTTTVSSTDDSFEFNSSASNDAAAVIVGALFDLMFSGLGEAIGSMGTHHGHDSIAPDAPPQRNAQRHAVPFSFRLGMLVSPLEGGTGLDFDLGWDVERFGVDLRLSRLMVSRDASPYADARTLGEMHVTYAPFVREEVRLRVEAGVSILDLPGALYVAPSAGVSVEACVLGPLDVEGRLQLTPGPYQQLDARAGLALHLGGLMLRGGMRYLALDSEVAPLGLALGFGPEFGLGFVF